MLLQVKTERERDSSPRRSLRFVPAYGRYFDIKQIEVEDKYRTSRTRDRIAYTLLASTIASLALAALYGFYSNGFGALERIWAVTGPLVGGIVGYYFHRDRKDSG